MKKAFYVCYRGKNYVCYFVYSFWSIRDFERRAGIVMKIHIEEGSDKPLTKEQVEALTKNEPTMIKCKFIFGPSKPIKIINDKGDIK